MPEPRLIYLDPIDPLTDRLLRLWDDDPEAPCAAQAIANRLQRTCSKNTVFRAAADGMPAWPRGPRVVLSSCIVQGVRMTSYEAVAAFLAELARVETERGADPGAGVEGDLMDMAPWTGSRFLNVEGFVLDELRRRRLPQDAALTVRILEIDLVGQYDLDARKQTERPAIWLQAIHEIPTIHKPIPHSPALFDSIRVAIAHAIPENQDVNDSAAWIGKVFALYVDRSGGLPALRGRRSNEQATAPPAVKLGASGAAHLDKRCREIGRTVDDFRQWVREGYETIAGLFAGDPRGWMMDDAAPLIAAWVDENKPADAASSPPPSSEGMTEAEIDAALGTGPPERPAETEPTLLP